MEIQILDKTFVPYISAAEIDSEIKRIANEISVDLVNETPIFIVVLNGAFMFASDLMKEITVDCEITFVKVQSYKGTSSSGRVDELIGLNQSLTGAEVIIVEDIVDTGITMDKIHKLIELQYPKSLKICTLLYKKTAHEGKEIPDYVGFEIENKFVVGYGLDFDQAGRNLKEIYQIKE